MCRSDILKYMSQRAFQMQYLLPEGFPPANGQWTREASDLGASLKGVDRKGAYVPNSALWVKLGVHPDGADFEIKKRGELVYINIFCFDQQYSANLLTIVEELYKQYGHGTVKRPTVGTWIHSVPVKHQLLRANEVELCQNLIVAFFWAVFAQWTKKIRPLS
jgi:hypothetical protein